ncbi:MAG TPA: 50S ribosomal protein L5 [Firmicutes bacterium]|jgi:large subunit ribosomal protein L5|nr:50S ribosomal protein L5 [Bacillota bacterium]
MARLKEKLDTEVKAALMQRFQYSNPMEVPKVVKVVINMGVGEAVSDSKALEAAVRDLTLISGQKPAITRAKKSVAAFKLRTGMAIGAKVTLRGERMYDFLDKLVNVSLPRIRDFQGVSPKGFDGRGNFALGIKEQLIFPEISIDSVDKARGMDIVIVTTAKTDEEALELLKGMGMPFRAA